MLLLDGVSIGAGYCSLCYRGLDTNEAFMNILLSIECFRLNDPMGSIGIAEVMLSFERNRKNHNDIR